MSAPCTVTSHTPRSPRGPRTPRVARRSLRRAAAALAVSAGAAAAFVAASPVAEAATTSGPYPIGTSTLIRCHGQDLWSVAGYLETSGTKTKTAPTVTMRGPDGTLYTLVGAWSITSRFNGVYFSGKYTYDMTFTAPNGSVWGTYKGTNSLDIYGRPYGALQGTCANPL